MCCKDICQQLTKFYLSVTMVMLNFLPSSVTEKLTGQNKNVRFEVLIVVIKNYCLKGWWRGANILGALAASIFRVEEWRWRQWFFPETLVYVYCSWHHIHEDSNLQNRNGGLYIKGFNILYALWKLCVLKILHTCYAYLKKCLTLL